MELKPGTKLTSAVCGTEVIVVRAPAGDVELSCGGQAMNVAGEAPTGAPASEYAEGTLMGKRYAHEEMGLEVLCTKPGDGSLSVGGAPLPLKEAKPLPSSD